MKKLLVIGYWLLVVVAAPLARGDIIQSSGGLASTNIDTSSELGAILTDEVGTGAFVLNLSPPLTTPKITTGILDVNGNSMLAFTPTASAVNSFTFANAATAGVPTISATGSDSNIGLTINSKGTANIVLGGNDVYAKLLTNRFFVVQGPSNIYYYITANGGSQASVSTAVYKWNSSATNVFGGTDDTGLARNASAGIGGVPAVEVNNGTPGTRRDFVARAFIADSTVTGSGTTGAQTINKSRGTVRFAAAASTLVVTNSLVTANTKLRAFPVGAFDLTATNFTCTAASGSFTITANAAATAETEVAFDLFIP